MSHSLLGDLLTSEGLLSEVERRQLIKKSGSGPAAFAKSILFNNILDDYELSAIIANSTDFEMAPADLGKIVDERAFYALDKNLITALEVMPLSFADNSLRVAMLDPLDRETIRQLEFFSGRRIQALVSPRSELYDAIRNWIPDFTALEPVNAKSNLTSEHDINNERVGNPEPPLILNSALDAVTEVPLVSESSGHEDTNLENLESDFQNNTDPHNFEHNLPLEPGNLDESGKVDFKDLEEIEVEEDIEVDKELDFGLESLSSQLLNTSENAGEIDLPDDETLINFDQFIDIKYANQRGLGEDSFDANIAPVMSQQADIQNTLETMNIDNNVEDITELFFEIPIDKAHNTPQDQLEKNTSATMVNIGSNITFEAQQDEEAEVEEEVIPEVDQTPEADQTTEAEQTNSKSSVPTIDAQLTLVTPRPPFSHTVTAIAALNHARTKLNLCRSTDEAYTIINSTLRKLGIEQALLITSANLNSHSNTLFSGMHFYCRTEKFVPIDPEQSALTFQETENYMSEQWSNILGTSLPPLIENLNEENTEIACVRMSINTKTALFICSWLQGSAQSLTVKNDLLATLVRLLKVEDMFNN
ncbi:MAG: hypothetical protein KBD78_09225 [Oligoflexales bacterium]|nr:hypothetical protein [Oligoflexales bacterium]